MKYFAVFTIALIFGYFLYPWMNPQVPVVGELQQSPSDKADKKEARAYFDKKDNIESVKETRPVDVKVDIQPEKKIEVPGPEKEKVVTKTNMTMAEKIMANKLDQKTFIGFAQFPSISVQDSRIIKLNGTYKGKLKPLRESRTGILENITFEVNQDPEKEMTRFEVIDIYDNHQYNVYQLTENSFQSVPGDENLLLLRSPQGFVIFNLKFFPVIFGKTFKAHEMTGEFTLNKEKTKENQLD